MGMTSRGDNSVFPKLRFSAVTLDDKKGVIVRFIPWKESLPCESKRKMSHIILSLGGAKSGG